MHSFYKTQISYRALKAKLKIEQELIASPVATAIIVQCTYNCIQNILLYKKYLLLVFVLIIVI